MSKLFDINKIHQNEEYLVIDSQAEPEYDEIIYLVANIADTPIAMISIFENNRQNVKARFGLTPSDVSREFSICEQVLEAPNNLLIIKDLSAEKSFQSHPFVTGDLKIKFYAGAAILNSEGHAIGSICIMDNKANDLTTAQVKSLKALARHTGFIYEAKLTQDRLSRLKTELYSAYSDLERFAFIASHDLKSPLNNIISLTFLLKDNFGNLMDEEGLEYLKFINDSAYKLSDLVTAILDYSKSSLLDVEKRDQIKIGTLLDEVVNGFNFPDKVKIQYSKDENILNVSKPILKLILQNLVLFLVHNNSNDQVLIKINFHELKDKYIIDVLDNGSGLTTERKDKLFDLVHSLKQQPNSEYGIGLPLVKRLLDKLRGGILVQSELGKGTSFVFTIAK